MLHLLFLLLPLSNESPREQLHKDSVLIYKTYQNEIAFLSSVTNYQDWYDRENHDDSMTACAFKRLKEFNGLRYYPVKMQNREGMGVAYEYPDPDNVEASPIIFDNSEIKFSILGTQTKFITDSKNKTRIPYFERIYFGTNYEPKYIEKLDPLTLEKFRK
jgi:hypothetical protein